MNRLLLAWRVLREGDRLLRDVATVAWCRATRSPWEPSGCTVEEILRTAWRWRDRAKLPPGGGCRCGALRPEEKSL